MRVALSFPLGLVLLWGLLSDRVPATPPSPEERGFPDIRSFTPRDYSAHNQIWTAREGPNGVMYFGANGEVVTPARIELVELAPWWATFWAKILYVLLGLASVYLIVRLRTFRLEHHGDNSNKSSRNAPANGPKKPGTWNVSMGSKQRPLSRSPRRRNRPS